MLSTKTYLLYFISSLFDGIYHYFYFFRSIFYRKFFAAASVAFFLCWNVISSIWQIQNGITGTVRCDFIVDKHVFQRIALTVHGAYRYFILYVWAGLPAKFIMRYGIIKIRYLYCPFKLLCQFQFFVFQ